jgi:hypothetical protein
MDWTKIHNFRYLKPGQSIFFEKNGNWTKTWTKKYIFHKKFHKMKSMDQKKNKKWNFTIPGIKKMEFQKIKTKKNITGESQASPVKYGCRSSNLNFSEI